MFLGYLAVPTRHDKPWVITFTSHNIHVYTQHGGGNTEHR